MQPSVTTTPDPSKWQDLYRLKLPDANQLDHIKSHLDLVLLALEAIANINSETILQAAKNLDLESVISGRTSLWQLPASNPQRKNTDGNKKLDLEESRALVLIICHLANQNQELLRRAIYLLEQATEQYEEPYQTALLGDYLDKFVNFYKQRIIEKPDISPTSLSQIALKLLLDLLFYSGKNGHRLLWLAVFDSATGTSIS